MMRLLFLLLTLVATAAAAQTAVIVRGNVMNALTAEGAADAAVDILTADSATVIASDTTRIAMERVVTLEGWSYEQQDKKAGAPFSLTAPAAGRYVLRVTLSGCEPYFQQFSVAEGRTRPLELGCIQVVPVRERVLSEAEVRATRLKMVYRGDTLVYNAAAFNVEQSEKLRRLVEQLPGVSIKDGQISVNGRRIAQLLLSGKDFFNGDIDRMLDNLPAYIADDIKVYEKAGEMSELTGRDMHDRLYVMDVHMKRDYHGVWFTDGSASYGTNNRYGFVAGASRMDDRQMITLGGDLNNLNQENYAGDGWISGSEDNSGHRRNKRAEVNYYIEPSKKFRFSADAAFRHQNNNEDSHTNAETFLADGPNLMQRSLDRSRTSATAVELKTSLRLRPRDKQSHTLNYAYNFQDKDSRSDNLAAGFYNLPGTTLNDLALDVLTTQYTDSLLNTLRNVVNSSSRRNSHTAELRSSFAFSANVLNVRARLNSDTRHDTSDEDYRLFYPASAVDDYRHKFSPSRTVNTRAEASAEFTWKYVENTRHDGQLVPFAGYNYAYTDGAHPLYRLDRLEDVLGQAGSAAAMTQEERLALCYESAQSYYDLHKDHEATAGVRLSHKIATAHDRHVEFGLSLGAARRSNRLDYTRAGSLYHVASDGTFFQPSVSITYFPVKGDKYGATSQWSFDYRTDGSLPETTSLVPITDDTDPLNVFRGNEGLSRALDHEVTVNYGYTWKKSQAAVNAGFTFHNSRHAVGTQSVFDEATGVRTYTPVNIPVINTYGGNLNYSRPLDKSQKFTFSARMRATYTDRPYLSFTTADAVGFDRHIRSLTLTPGASLNATLGRWNANVWWVTDFDRLDTPDAAAACYRTTHIIVGLSGFLPGNVYLTTNFNTMKRGGYSERGLCRWTPAWNATLMKSILKGRMSLSLTASDILSRRSNLFAEFDGTTRTENYRSLLSRYVLFSVYFHLTTAKQAAE